MKEVQLKENVYVMKCKNVVIKIHDKCKSIQVGQFRGGEGRDSTER